MQHVILETNAIWLGVCMCNLGVCTICCSVMFLFDLAKLIIERIATSRMSEGFCYLVKKKLQYLILANRCCRVPTKKNRIHSVYLNEKGVE